MPLIEISTVPIKVRFPAGLHARLDSARQRTPFAAAEIVRRALRYYRRRAGVAVPRYTESATRADSVVMTIPDVPVDLLASARSHDVRIVDIVAWYLDVQGALPPTWPWAAKEGE